MPLPASGPIKASDVNVELGNSSTAQISLGQASVRTLFAVASGAIRLGADSRGKADAFAAAITTNQTNLNLRTFAVAAGWNQSAPATITVNAGVYVYATSTVNAGLTIDGSWPRGVTVINNGFIIGQGGAGATLTGSGQASNDPGLPGGPAISLEVNCNIINNSGAFIAGGGGGGGTSQGGGGAGGAGGGGRQSQGGPLLFILGGAPGNAGSNGGTGPQGIPSGSPGGGGGRILPGTGGTGGRNLGNYQGNFTSTGGGAGGGGGFFLVQGGPEVQYKIQNIAAGGGGGWGASGGGGLVTGFGNFTPTQGGAGGAGGAAGSNGNLGGGGASGGAGGQAIQRNGFTVTTSGAGTIYGAIS